MMIDPRTAVNHVPAMLARLLLASLVALWGAQPAQAQGYVTANLTHETLAPSGLTKQCHYEWLGNYYSITLSATSLCPLTYRFAQ